MGSTTLNSVNAGEAEGHGLRAWMQSATAEVWAKFLLALLGLGLAFGAALFSTATGEAGHLWVSVILASVALLMAVFVGLVTVPYLARRVALERLRQTFHYEVTKTGVVYVLVTLVIGIAALNTGNNLLYIVVAAMLAAILVSGVVSALVLRGLKLDVRLPEHVFARRSVVRQDRAAQLQTGGPLLFHSCGSGAARKKGSQAMALGTHHFCFSPESSSPGPVGAPPRLSRAPCRSDAQSARNLRGHGLFSLSSSKS